MIIGIAWRNIFRHKKRTALTAMIISIGVIMVILFGGATSAFKKVMVGQITDSMIGHIQVHKKGYMMNVDTQPLDMTIKSKLEKKLYNEFKNIPEITEISPRLKFNGMLSNYDKSVAMKIAAVDPVKEAVVSPALAERINGIDDFAKLKKGEIVISEIIAKSMKLKKGDEIVLIGTNAAGSVNGVTLKIAGISELAIGPDGKSGYMHLDDAKELLRMDEVLELALRVDKLENVEPVTAKLNSLAETNFINKEGKPAIEVHPWTKLTNFTGTLTIIDVMALFLKVILIFIVLFSIMNIMIMAVYERIGEIGTISAIGTLPGTITVMFMWEGFFLGILSSAVGSIIGIIINYGVSAMNITYKFSRNIITLKPEVSITEVMVIIATITVISIVASLVPAHKASKLEPVEALRG